jgi:hypothetical protein
MKESEMARMIVCAVKMKREAAIAGVIRATGEHAKAVAIRDAFYAETKNDLKDKFGQYNRQVESCESVLRSAGRERTKWDAIYDYTVSTFLDKLPDKQEKGKEIDIHA